MATAVELPIAERSEPVTHFTPAQYRCFANLAEAFFHNAKKNGQFVAYDQAEFGSESDHGPRRYEATLQATSKARVLKIANQLAVWGVRSQDAVAVLSLNRPEWTEAEMAIYTVGGVVAAMYVRVSQDRLQHMLRDSGAKVAIVENGEQLTRIVQADTQGTAKEGARLPPGAVVAQLEHILVLEDFRTPPEANHPGLNVKTLRQVLVEQPVKDEQAFAFVNTQREDLAAIYYTSGSSGLPTGVPVKHGQALENLYQIVVSGLVDYSQYDEPNAPQPFVTLLLPERAHAFPARTAQLAATSPVRARYPAIVDRTSSQVSDAYRDSLRRDLREGGAGFVPIVPKILVAIEQRVRERLTTGGWGERFAWLVIANAFHKILNDAAGRPKRMTNWLNRLLKPLWRRITNKIRSQIVGPDFGFFISGGAKLPLETAAFLWAINLPVYEGYGSTESNCPIATNTPLSYRLGSVGQVFRGIETRTDPVTGELWLRGPNVVMRYWNLAGGRREAWTDDGWYRTRDVGYIDDDGFLYIQDRIDNILVSWNGENVSATAIEQRFHSIPYVDTAIVIGHQRPALVALVALNEDMVRRWAARSGHLLAVDWKHDLAVITLLRQQIELEVNCCAGHPCERIRHFAVIEPLTLEEQTLTVTEKVRRLEIERRYAAQIDALYQDQAHWLPSFEPDPDLQTRPTRFGSLAGNRTEADLHDRANGAA